MSTVDKKMNVAGRSPLEPNRNRLDSWKEIALFLDRNVRTAQRWEKREGLPVHRHIHQKASTVYSSKQEVDAWLKSRYRARNEHAPKRTILEYLADWLSPTLLVTRRLWTRSRRLLAVVPPH